MTVLELIKTLEKHNPDKPVIIELDDISGTFDLTDIRINVTNNSIRLETALPCNYYIVEE